MALLSGKGNFAADQSNFSKIPGSPVAYWLSLAALKCFDGAVLSDFADTKTGMQTCDNNRFLRLWFEVDIQKECLHNANEKTTVETDVKWIPYNKGGDFRKWYGNQDYVLNWQHDGDEAKAYAVSLYKCVTRTIKNIPYFYRETISWSKISSGSIAFRYYPDGFIFDVAGCCIYCKNIDILGLLGLVNSKVAKYFLNALSPTINFEAGHVNSIPIVNIGDGDENSSVLTKSCISTAKKDWDSYETSWDFKRHPLVRLKLAGAYSWGDKPPVMRLTSAYNAWKLECEGRFEKLNANEEELNRIFIDIYGLQDELTPNVADKDITVHRIFDTKDDVPESMQGSNYVRTKRDEIVSLLSYAVGCMFGRYSVDVDGLAYAGGDWDDGKYKTFLPDRDGILPITDEEYLEDDIISRLCDWLKAAYGADTLEENLDFIAGALGGKGNSSREIIRNYFLKDFFKDHCKTYQKRPIYWLFDSGKQNGFKALIYLHRYTPDTIGNLRVDYLHKMQRVYESEINRMQDMIDHSTNAREVAASTKRKEKLQKQLKECRDYDEMIAHLALSRIELDLDDGVKVNYEKIQTASDGKKYAVLAKI